MSVSGWLKDINGVLKEGAKSLGEMSRNYVKESRLRLLDIEQDLVLQQSAQLNGENDKESKRKKLAYSKRNSKINKERLELLGVEPAFPSVYTEESQPKEEICPRCRKVFDSTHHKYDSPLMCDACNFRGES